MIRRIGIFVSILTSATLVAGVAVAGAPKDDWPNINGELWLNTYDFDIPHTGTTLNDELLGGHGDDTIYGRSGADVIWGDHTAPTRRSSGATARRSRTRARRTRSTTATDRGRGRRYGPIQGPPTFRSWSVLVSGASGRGRDSTASCSGPVRTPPGTVMRATCQPSSRSRAIQR